MKVRMIRRFALAALALLSFASCSHVLAAREDTCTAVDWWEAGRTDGAQGLPLAQALAETQRRCNGRSVNLDEFENGHDAGLVDYCTPAQGLALGRNGAQYQHACPSYLEAPFLAQYQMGLRMRALETATHAIGTPARSAASQPSTADSTKL